MTSGASGVRRRNSEQAGSASPLRQARARGLSYHSFPSPTCSGRRIVKTRPMNPVARSRTNQYARLDPEPRPDRRPVPVASSRCVSRVGRAIPPRPTSTSLRSNAPADRYLPCHRAAGEQLRRLEYSALDSHWNAGSHLASLFARRVPQTAMSKTPPSADDYRKRDGAVGKRLRRQGRRKPVSSWCAGSNSAPRVGRQRGLAGRKVQGEGKTQGESATTLAPRVETMPSRPMRHACSNTAAPSACSVN